MNDRRRDAARRVAALHPPLPQIFAALRVSAGVTEPAQEPDPLGGILAVALADAGTTDPDDLALALALAAEETVGAYAAEGARDARTAGVPGDADVRDAAVDAVLAVLQPYAAGVFAGTAPATPPPDLLDRLRGVARSAGVVAAVRGTGWVARQRFGAPFCPRAGCYGRDGAELTAERVAADGLPPYGDSCNCVVAPSPG